MLGGTCSQCCSCACGNTQYGYEGQTSRTSASGRWCCNNQRPSELTVTVAAVADGGPWTSYQRVSGLLGPGLCSDSTRGVYAKRYKRTLTLDVGSLNVNYVLRAGMLSHPVYFIRLCAYTYGPFACPRIYAGTGDGVFDDQTFPRYTMTFQTCNSNLPGGPATAGTIRREYEYRPYQYLGFSQYAPSGDWTRDASLDTENTALPCTYLWAFTGQTVLTEPACDLRPLGLTWSGSIIVGNDVALSLTDNESVRTSTGSTPIEGSMLPQFTVQVSIDAS